jgi:hypothetical protein
MKQFLILSVVVFVNIAAFSQGIKKIADPLTPCGSRADVDAMPGIYTDHNNTKYGFALKGTPAEKATMMKNLIAIEKLEEASRKDFKLTGCIARADFARHGSSDYGKNVYTSYWYSMGVYALVWGDFNMKNGNPMYEIPVQAKVGPNFEKDKSNNPSHVSQYISEATLMVARSDNYKDYHSDFLKLNNGNGYVEHWEMGSRYDTHGPNSYQCIDRRYFLTRPGVPLLVPVSRKQYLLDMLEYFEIEKANFEYANAEKIKRIGNNTADYAKKALAALEADKLAYPKIYEAKKAKVNDLLAKQKPEWLQKPAVVDQDRLLKDANGILEALGRFYDQEGEYKCALYVLNPAYFVSNNGQAAKPLLIEVQFRYEITKDYGYSSRLFNNWEQHFDMNALRKMLE